MTLKPLESMARLALCACASLLVGCASATIAPEQSSAPAGVVGLRPDRIVVYDFKVSAAQVSENDGPLQKVYWAVKKSNDDQAQADRLSVGEKAAHELSEDLVKQLQELGFDAQTLPRGTAPGGNALIVDGEFLNADEGNRARRMIIGFGAGASKLETQVTVSRVSTQGPAQELLSFKTYSDSGKMPGAAVTMGAGAAAQGASAASASTAAMSAGKIYGSMLSTLASKTSKQISAYLSQYFAKQGWISSNQVQTANLAQ
jgi:hypothetical protein